MTEIQKPYDLKGRSLLKESDFTKAEFEGLIDFAITLKEYKKNGIKHHYLSGKNIALLFEKNSTRTRAAFTVASIDLGAHPEFLGKNDIQLGKKESVEDTAKVLGRMFDGIEFRGFSQQAVEDLAKFSGVPVWNGLTDDWHPTQMLAGAMLGVNVRICTPKSLNPKEAYVDIAKEKASQYGGSVMITDNIAEAVENTDAIYTDVWVSMGEESEFEQRINLLKDYQVNQQMFDLTGKDSTIFLHCLPAFHDTNTLYGQEIYEKYGLAEMEVTDQIFRSEHSKVFDQAENRMHTIKAVMAATLGS
ncbi:ornithine carbamoyltransferase [Staphylococcus aureus]|nr:ornithine carbamoyltransferase [Staphylococcus aureus]MBU4932147.1 ornithine carbamoyltransferase [Staphylococcus aureus]